MRKYFIFCFAFIVQQAYAQHVTIPSSIDAAPELSNEPMASSKALWDLQFSFNATDSANGDLGMAGVAYFNNEFWVSRWASDTLYRFTNSGSLISEFVIAGISGTRSITTDGTNLYLGNATNTIYTVDPSTQSLIGTISSTASVTSRFLTYDPTLDGGNGGFWTGNFNTDIVAISMSGVVLSTIPAATHGLGGMYGAAYDQFSSGGPYLWIYHQGGANTAELTALQLPSGNVSNLTHDVFLDLNVIYGLSTGLSGGAFFTNSLIPGQNSIVVLTQGNPHDIVAAFDSEFVPIEDVASSGLRATEGYTKIPLKQVFNETFELTYDNLGNVMIDTLYAEMEFYHNGTLIGSESFSALNVPANGSNVFTSAPFSMANGLGQYTVKGYVYPNAALTDTDHSNDTLYYNFEVDDSLYARDLGPSTGVGYYVNPIDSAYVATLFELFYQDTVVGIMIDLEPSEVPSGESTFGLIFDYNGSLPTTEIARGVSTLMNAGQNEYYLSFGNEVILSAGTYAFGCFEPENAQMGLKLFDQVYTPGTNFHYSVGTSSWIMTGAPSARGIRPVLKYEASSAGLIAPNLDNFNVFPVPSNDFVTIEFADETEGARTIAVLSLDGSEVIRVELSGDVKTYQLDLHALHSGTYLLRVHTADQAGVKRIVKQ